MYGFLADLVEANNPHILGANNSNLTRIVAIIAEALAVEVLPPEEEARKRMINLVKMVQVSAGSHQSLSRSNSTFSMSGQPRRVPELCCRPLRASEKSHSRSFKQLVSYSRRNTNTSV